MIHPLVAAAGRTRAFTALAPHLLHRIDLITHRLTRGHILPSRLLLPTVMLTTVGCRSGRPRTTPVCAHLADDGTWLLVASNYGKGRHPAWSTNLLADSQARITASGRVHHMSARLLTEDEREAHQGRIIAVLPVIHTWESTAARTFRIFLLSPKAPSPERHIPPAT
ncbi:nitroreductase family deazaflavin-dependent oxidoreductase [Streptomyces sp. NPDC127068]|uniref:nitroreductase family deazaflavin-dependent oxidoreductase n=1 Tax=Streptomyces sp. NPDC127068 TaxID=3347127 RepID=UPI0036678D71